MKKKAGLSVFEKYAHEYDLITNATQREVYHRREIKAVIEKLKPASVLDAGCATGLTSMIFASEGIPTVGLDRSRNMLAIAKEKYKDKNYPVEFKYGEFENLPKNLYGKFDLVACLANSISGVHTLSELWHSINNFYKVLKPGGYLLLQMLNYSSLEEGKLMPIRATNNDGIIYIRYSERHKKRLFVYVTRIDANMNPPEYEVFRHDFDNFSGPEIIGMLKKAKFSKIKKYSDLYLEKKFTRSSRDLVIVSQRID